MIMTGVLKDEGTWEGTCEIDSRTCGHFSYTFPLFPVKTSCVFTGSYTFISDDGETKDYQDEDFFIYMDDGTVIGDGHNEIASFTVHGQYNVDTKQLKLFRTYELMPKRFPSLQSNGDQMRYLSTKGRHRCWLDIPEDEDLLFMVYEMMTVDTNAYFHEPVDAEALQLENYHEIITHPMDFGTICSNIQAGQYVDKREDFIRDVSLVFTNALYFNDKRSEVYQLADTMYVDFIGKVRRKEIQQEKRADLQTQVKRMKKMESQFERIRTRLDEMESFIENTNQTYRKEDFEHLNSRFRALKRLKEDQFNKLLIRIEKKKKIVLDTTDEGFDFSKFERLDDQVYMDIKQWVDDKLPH